ncbi:unnamed protein product [Closterium sp. NIES-65]|nr:unnamed protein product [Closterium sp. NIES-65]
MGRLGSAPGLGLLGRGGRLGAVATVGEVMVGGSSTGEEVQGVVPWHMREARPGVLELNPGNLHAALRRRPTFLMFYAPWCPHCKRMEQAWADLAGRLKDLDFNVQVARVDAYRYPQLAEEFQIPGFPTLVLFDGEKPLGAANSTLVLFDGEKPLGMHWGKRDVDTLVGFVDATLP